jgi:hypothetical protein
MCGKACAKRLSNSMLKNLVSKAFLSYFRRPLQKSGIVNCKGGRTKFEYYESVP